uniref:Uncharacterized protein n=1 Tax=Acrobeloides nanus TaxID=290746 RepID=A0A914CHV7_9BILA
MTYYEEDPYNDYTHHNNDFGGHDAYDDYGYVRPVSTGGSIGLNDDYPIGDYDPDITQYYPDYNDDYHSDTPQYEVYTYDKPKFYGSTTHADEYYWKDPGPLERSSDNQRSTSLYNRDLPAFDGETTNNSTFVPHIVSKPENSDKKNPLPAQERPKIPFYGETSNRATYTHKTVEKPNKVQQESLVGPPKDQPFEATTTARDVYGAKRTEKPVRYTRKDNLNVGGEFLYGTSNREAYVQHKVERPKKRQRSAPTLFGRDQFAQDTTTRAIYTPKSAAQCPAEKMIRAKNGLTLTINGQFKNGHYYFPVKSARDPDSGKSSLTPKRENFVRPKSDGHISAKVEQGKSVLNQGRSNNEANKRDVPILSQKDLKTKSNLHTRAGIRPRQELPRNQEPLNQDRLQKRRQSTIGIVPKQLGPMPRPEAGKPKIHLKRPPSADSIILSEINYDKLL